MAGGLPPGAEGGKEGDPGCVGAGGGAVIYGVRRVAGAGGGSAGPLRRVLPPRMDSSGDDDDGRWRVVDAGLMQIKVK